MIKLLAVIFLTLGLTPRCIQSALADTWDYCNCRWEEWEAWSDCNSLCFGQRERSRSVWLTQYTGCDEFSDCATNDEGWDYDDCNTVCHNGGTPSGNFWAPCTCTPAYYESCCTTRVDCGTPDSISNGNVNFPSTYYGDVTTYSCHSGYNITGGDVSRTCQSNRAWTGQRPSCVYAQHCTSHPCQNGATCVDLLGDYTCVCASGWSGQHCENDVQPPTIVGCHQDIYVNATDITVPFSWTEPEIYDEMGQDLDIVKNYNQPEYDFPWGDFTVQYVAFKPSNGLSSECTFQIRVRPTPCVELNVPANGALLCNNWQTDYGRFCLVTCQDSHTIDLDLSYRTWYVCGASGTWIAPAPLPDCHVPISSPDDILDYQPEYFDHSFTSSCNDDVTMTSLQTLYIERMQEDGSFVDFCERYPDECHMDNVEVKCS